MTFVKNNRESNIQQLAGIIQTNLDILVSFFCIE